MKKILIPLAFLLSVPAFAEQLSSDDGLTLRSAPAKPAGSQIEVGFSLEAGSEALVLKVINTSQRSIRLAGYSFTSPKVVKALLDAKKRGVDIAIAVDDRGNHSKSSKAALNLVVNAGICPRMISTYAIHHDKYIVSDGDTVQTGSFNYSQAAAKSNSENVLVIWHNQELAATYLKHREDRFKQGVDYRSSY